ncbi:LapA family protein [Ideonella dechloratans]|uniref:LapA family protein n=1 Tax=Ideonella dechloratans TaxID=36863 RepID=A0A643FH61_IDEDE|nr:LapA family protein [Ideonella dechloratans]KAB0583526.1 LapA family protein [Ideonella dechloratans]UFU09061.1 LapA family protein [Ideonella dechloratans]
MRFLVWLLRAFLFFALFAFALNNQQVVTVHWFFGFVWNAPLVIVVLAALVAGLVFGVLAMTPSWWRQRRRARQRPSAEPPAPAEAPSASAARAIPADFPDGI